MRESGKSLFDFPASLYVLNAALYDWPLVKTAHDAPMATVREFSYSPDLGFNLASSLDSAQVGNQVFTVTELNTNEPDPSFFQPPDGYGTAGTGSATAIGPR